MGHRHIQHFCQFFGCDIDFFGFFHIDAPLYVAISLHCYKPIICSAIATVKYFFPGGYSFFPVL